MELAELAQKFAALRAKRKERAEVVKKMEELEKQMAGMLRASLVANGLKTANLDGIGSICISSRDHAEIRDFDKMAMFMAQQLVTANKNGSTLSDAFSLLQRRAALGNIQQLIEAGFSPEEMGVEIVEKPDITFTPTK